MKNCKLAYAAGAIALVLASAITFRIATGKCPLACLCETFSSSSTAPAN